MPHPIRFLLLALPLATLLTGCALENTAVPSPVAAPAGIRGTVMGGNIPISGSTIYLVQIGESGYGVPNSTNILATTTTDANGSFTLPSFTGCGFGHVMIEARGGNPGLVSGTNNSAIFLAAIPALQCRNLSTSTHIHINEVTTVATAYTLRPFISGNNVGTSSSNILGLSNAYSTYTNLVNTATGTSPGTSVPAGMSVPTATINALANSLTACVNTTDPTSSACTNLFGYTGVASTGVTANTFNMAVAIASSPTTHATDIFNAAGSSPPFQSALAYAPPDWSLPVVYTSGNLNSPQTALAIDANGNVWVATDAGLSGTLEELGASGTLAATNLLNGTLDAPSALAFDQNGNLIIANNASGDASVMEYNVGSAALTFKIANDPGDTFRNPTSLTIDRSNNIIVGDNASTFVASLSDSNGNFGNTVNTNATTASPVAVTNNGAILINGANSLGVYTAGLASGSVSTTCGCYTGSALEVDSSSNLYTFYKTTQLIYETPSPYTSGRQSGSLTFSLGNGSISAFAMDGQNTLWASAVGAPYNLINLTNNPTLNHENPNVAGLLFSSTSTSSAQALAIDGSGNIWLANSAAGGLTQVVGAAAPVITPRATAVKNSSLGLRP